MTEPSTLDQFTAEVVQAEQIPLDRDLTAEETERFADLERRLRAAWMRDRSDELRALLRRTKAIRRARKPVAPAPAPAEQLPASPAAKKRVEHGPQQIRRELTEMAAKQRLQPQLSGRALRRLEAIMNATASRVAHDAEYQRLYQWALRIHGRASKAAVAAASRAGKRTGQARGLVQNPALLYGGREVLGGAPSTGRGR